MNHCFKIILVLVLCVSLLSCSNNNDAIESTRSVSHEINISYSDKSTNSNNSSVVTLKHFIENLSIKVKEKSVELDKEFGHFFIDNAYFSIFDLDNDNEGELLFGVTTYKTLSVFIFDLQNDEIICLENSITDDDTGYKQVNLKFYPKNRIIESVYTYYTGTSIANVNREFSKITDNKINIIKVITSIENIDTDEIQYFDSNIEGVEISKDEYNKIVKELVDGDKYQDIVLDNYIENYLTGTTLSDTLIKAYEEYQNER